MQVAVVNVTNQILRDHAVIELVEVLIDSIVALNGEKNEDRCILGLI